MSVTSEHTQRPAREALLNGPALLMMSAVVVVALFVLFPRQPAFRDPQNLRASDALSIAYLRVLVRSDPDNIPLRLSFVQLLTEAGNHDEASTALAPLLTLSTTDYAFEIALARLRLQLQQLFRAPDGERAPLLRTAIQNGFHSALPLAGTETEQDALLIEARKFGEPGVLAALYETLLARVDVQGPRRGQLLADTARLHLAANQPAIAAQRWHEAFFLLTAAEPKRAAAAAAMQAYLAAGETVRALNSAKQFISAQETDQTLLALAADIAQQNGDDAQARDWLYRLRAQQPDNDALLERLLALELALGDLPAALTLARELDLLPSPSPARQLLLARSYDWNGESQAALLHWFALAMQTPDPENESRAFALAVALADDSKVVPLVASASARRRLNPGEADAYVASGLRNGEPSRLAQTLQDYLQRESQDRAAWAAMARLQQASGEPVAALRAWQRAEQLAPLRPAERLAIAESYWRSGQPEPALNSLLPLSSAPPVGQEVRYWQLLAEIGWALERGNVARPAYQQLLARYQPDDKLAIDRLLQLASQAGDNAAMERQALYGWNRLRAREYFVVLLELAQRANDGKRIDQLLAEAQQQEARFAKEPRYWQFRAERAMLRREHATARASLERLAQLRANDPEVIEALLWLLLAEEPVATSAVNLLVERYSALAEGDPILAEAMAAAEQVLGRPAEAARWYALTLPARARDLPWLLTVADNLEWLGCTVTANQFRYRVLQQLQMQSPPMVLPSHPPRLADAMYGRRYFAGDLEQQLPDADDLRELIEQWRLQGQIDNARWFALRWQQKRLLLSDWEELADAWQEQNRDEIGTMLLALQAELQLAPEGPLSSAVLPLSLNDVAARARRFSAGRADPTVPDPTRELASCRQQYEHFSTMALPVPAAIPVVIPASGTAPTTSTVVTP